MRRNWSRLPKGDVATNYPAPWSVTMNKKGYIYLSARTWRNFGEPKAVEILFDNINSTIGLKPTSPQMRDAYIVGAFGRARGKVVRAHRLILEYRVHLPHTINFVNPELDEDGILVLDIRTAKKSLKAEAVAERWKTRPDRKENGGRTKAGG